MQKSVEILSPAGNMASFIAAVNAGADAIYMGVGKFNARAMAENFTIEEYIWCINEAHKRDVKVYLTLNTLVKNCEIKDILRLVAKLYSKGLDAVILQDLGLAIKIHELFPKLSMHASTQMSVYSLEQVEFLKSIGFTRVVLARELSASEIENICKNTDVEIEVFVHGALCVSVSGQCNMSKLIGDRSANRGTCAQPCRMKYSLYKEGEKSPIVANKYILSKKDIWGLEYIERLVQVGVKSLKIEGRNKSPEYVALATKVYKQNLSNGTEDFDRFNNLLFEKDRKSLLQLFNRSGKSEGYLNGVKFKDSITVDTPKNVGVKLGKVIDINKKYIKVKLEEDINLHDGIEISETMSTIVTCIRNSKFEIINTMCTSGETVWLGDVNSKCKMGDIVYKTSSNELNQKLNTTYVAKLARQKEYNVKIDVKKDKNVEIIVNLGKKEIKHTSEIIPEESIKKSLTKDDIKVPFSKTEDSSIKFINIDVNVDSGLFLKISQLNEIRRNLVEQIEKSYIIDIDIKKELELIENINLDSKSEAKFNKLNSLYIYSYNKDRNYKEEYYNRYNKKLKRLYIVANDYAIYYKEIFEKYSDVELFFVIPNVTLNKLSKYINQNLEEMVKLGVKGVLVGNYQYMNLLSRLKQTYSITIGADYSLNICNNLTIDYLNKFGFDFVTLSLELDNDEVLELVKNNSNIELVENLACAMTSRYCIIGSFVGTEEKKICNRACMQGKYYILDNMNKRYDIICDNYDCIMRLVRNKDRYNEEIKEIANIRNAWL